jgi:hypothetical protein
MNSTAHARWPSPPPTSNGPGAEHPIALVANLGPEHAGTTRQGPPLVPAAGLARIGRPVVTPGWQLRPQL